MNELDVKKFWELMDDNPDELLRMAEEREMDFSGLVEMGIGKSLVKKWHNFSDRLPDLPDNTMKSVESVYWLVYLNESFANDMIADAELQCNGKTNEEVEENINKMDFGDKITEIKKYLEDDDEFIGDPNEDLFVKFLYDIKDVRNDLAHMRISNLKYKGHSLNAAVGQLMLLLDAKNCAENKTTISRKV